jgi:anti-anti-sigma factor
VTSKCGATVMTELGYRHRHDRTFAYTVQDDRSGVVLYLSGALDEACIDELAAAVSPYCDGPLVLDMENVTLVTGGCLRVLIAASKVMSRYGHTPMIHKPPPVLARVLEICEAEAFFTVTR